LAVQEIDQSRSLLNLDIQIIGILKKEFKERNQSVESLISCPYCTSLNKKAKAKCSAIFQLKKGDK
jgi:hypothetical protein